MKLVGMGFKFKLKDFIQLITAALFITARDTKSFIERGPRG